MGHLSRQTLWLEDIAVDTCVPSSFTATQRTIAERFCVSGALGEQRWQRWRRSGSSAAKPHAGGRQQALDVHGL